MARALPSARGWRQRGVSLIEALVALAVMSFGMLAVVGVQATLRQNADIAKQRAEAVRIGQGEIERWRAFSQIEVDPAGVRVSYDGIQATGAQLVSGFTTNTQYTVVRAVVSTNDNAKTARVTVSWLDRSGGAQSIVLDSHVARSDPSLTAGAINASSFDSPLVRPRGRHVAIPTEAKDLGGGISGFMPPMPAGTPATTVWVFNNTTGLIVQVCTVPPGLTTATLTGADVAGCPREGLGWHLLSGYVRFATSAAQPTAADAAAPTSPALNLDMSLLIAGGRTATCFDDSPTTSVAAATRSFVTYYCAIPADATRAWSGYSTIVPLPFTDVAGSAWHIAANGLPEGTVISHGLCRYTPATSDAQVVPNWQHPRIYRVEYADPDRRLQPLPTPPLTNQNFLVILAPNSCPTDTPADPSGGDFANSNTLTHTPLP